MFLGPDQIFSTANGYLGLRGGHEEGTPAYEARENLGYAAKVVEALRSAHPKEYVELVYRTKLASEEPADWRRAADAIYVAYDQELGIHPQDDIKTGELQPEVQPKKVNKRRWATTLSKTVSRTMNASVCAPAQR